MVSVEDYLAGRCKQRIYVTGTEQQKKARSKGKQELVWWLGPWFYFKKKNKFSKKMTFKTKLTINGDLALSSSFSESILDSEDVRSRIFGNRSL